MTSAFRCSSPIRSDREHACATGETTRLAEDEFFSGFRVRVQLVDVFSRALRGPAEEAFRNERTAAAAVVRDTHFETSGFKNFHGGHSDLRAVVVREGVVERGAWERLSFGLWRCC